MADTILVIVEQREGKLNRVSWETIAAGQAIAAQTGWTLEAAVVGSGVAAIAGEVAAKKVAKVYAIESARLEPYTPDAFVHALQEFIGQASGETGVDAAYLPGAGFCAEAGDGLANHSYQRRDRL